MNPPSADLKFDEIIKHLDAGYQNTQSVVRFVDTKATAVVAGLTAVAGLQVGLGSWTIPTLIQYSKKTNGWSGLWSGLPWIFGILTLILLIQCIGSAWFAYRTLIPRNLGASEASILFPFINPVNPDQRQKDRIKLYENTPLQKDAIKDYTTQLNRMGEISFLKISNCSQAISLFFGILIVTGSLLICNLALVVIVNLLLI